MPCDIDYIKKLPAHIEMFTKWFLGDYEDKQVTWDNSIQTA